MPKVHRFNPYVPFPREMEADFERIRQKHEDNDSYLSEHDRFAREAEAEDIYFNEEDL